jgi:hypothetical protein
MRKWIKIDHVDFPIDPNWRNIGISLSGGADSALLTYLVCKNLPVNCRVHISTQIRCWKTRPWQEHISAEVFDWFIAKFPELEFIRHTNFIPPDLEEPHTTMIKDENGKMKSGNRIILRSFNEYLAHKEKLDAWFAGVTLNPDVELEGALNDRQTPSIDAIMLHMGVTVCHPFIETRKDWIIGQFIKYDIAELLNITRSCEGDNEQYPEVFKGLDYATYKPGQYVPTCKKCFWCQERQWGVTNAMQQ